jgi:transposase-like protein
MDCPHCQSTLTKKNGHTHYGKQNYQCRTCRRQFVEFGQKWFIPDSKKYLVNKLLSEPEPISLSDICRVCSVSKTWLVLYIKEFYNTLSESLM